MQRKAFCVHLAALAPGRRQAHVACSVRRRRSFRRLPSFAREIHYYASRLEATPPNAWGFSLALQRMLGAALAYDLMLEINASNLTDHSNWTSNRALYLGAA